MIGWHPDRLVAARESIAMTQAELARRCRCAPSAISHWETGKRAPDCANLAKLAVALGVTSDYLLGLAGEPVEIDADNLPYHLRADAAPLAMCTQCRRKTSVADLIDKPCQMPQPDGTTCGGKLQGAIRWQT